MKEGGSSKEYNEDGKYGKNGKEVRLRMATREAGRARNEEGGRQISLKKRSWGKAKGRRRRRSTTSVGD
jgi:hypothetical protein